MLEKGVKSMHLCSYNFTLLFTSFLLMSKIHPSRSELFPLVPIVKKQ